MNLRDRLRFWLHYSPPGTVAAVFIVIVVATTITSALLFRCCLS